MARFAEPRKDCAALLLGTRRLWRSGGEAAPGGKVFGPHINHAGLRVSGRRAPTRSPIHARQGDLTPAHRHRGVHTFEADGLQNCPEALGFCRINVRAHVIRCQCHPRDRGRPGREGLCGPGLFSGHVALRCRPLLDGPQRLSGHAVEHEKQSRLRRHRYNINHLALVPHCDQLRFGAQVQIPDIVMNDLEVPEPFAGACVQGNDAVTEQVLPRPPAAIVIVCRRAGGEVGDASFLVDRKIRPGVRSAVPLVRIGRPRLIAIFTRQRDRVECPCRLSSEHIIGAEPAGRVVVSLARRRTEDDQVLEYVSRALALNDADRLRVAAEPFSQIDISVFAKRSNGSAGFGVDLLQHIIRRKDNPLVFAVLALPKGIASTGGSSFSGMRPDLLSRGGVQRNDGAVAVSGDIHDVADDERAERQVRAGGQRVEPDLLELAHIGFIDLCEGGVLH